MERAVRKKKEKYELLKIVRDESNNKGLTEDVKQIRAEWLQLRKDYVNFCEENDLVVHGDRLVVVAGEDLYKRTSGRRDSRVTNIEIPSAAKP